MLPMMERRVPVVALCPSIAPEPRELAADHRRDLFDRCDVMDAAAGSQSGSSDAFDASLARSSAPMELWAEDSGSIWAATSAGRRKWVCPHRVQQNLGAPSVTEMQKISLPQ
jgi:hypothetical protein